MIVFAVFESGRLAWGSDAPDLAIQSGRFQLYL